MHSILFTIFSAVAIGAALLMILQREMVYSVGLMILVLMSIAGLFLLLNAQFLFFVQLIVYAGAVMVFFVFASMMIGQREIPIFNYSDPQFWGALIITSLLFFQVGTYAVFIPTPPGLPGNYSVDVEGGDPIVYLGERLFTDFVVALLGLGVLLLVALVGAVYISRDPSSDPENTSIGAVDDPSTAGGSAH